MKKCKNCNEYFCEKHHNEKYCSAKCRNIFWSRDYYNKNKEKILKKMKTDEYKEKEREYKRTPERKRHLNKYLREKRKTDPIWKIKINFIDRMRRHNYLRGKFVMAKLEEYLGYSINELYKYLLSTLPDEYDINDYLIRKLEIDHIIPYNRYIMLEPGDEEFKKCWNIKNLRFVLKNKNLKRNRVFVLNIDEIKKYDLFDILPIGMLDIIDKI